ncbi:unnamed protein product [Effrenium voratum]|nr:unnamed protein product [Effrenium voratum]
MAKSRFPKIAILLTALAFHSFSQSFAGIGGGRQQPRTRLQAVCAQVKEPPTEGDRVVVDGNDGPIVVAKIDGRYYAVDAKCPHLGLPMKKGQIESGPDGPKLTCNFHNSQHPSEQLAQMP